jgi:hypothetical protein
MKKPINEVKRMQQLAGLITESEYQKTLQEEKGLVKVGEKVLSQDKEPYWAEDNVFIVNKKISTTYTKDGYDIEVIDDQGYFEGQEDKKFRYKLIIKILKDGNLIKKKLFWTDYDKWKGMSDEDFINYTIQLINGNMNQANMNQADMNQADDMMNENQSSSLDVTDKKAVLQFLADNGIDDNYFKSMGGKEIEYGGDEWLDILSILTGKDAYTDEFDVADDKKISDLLITIDRLGINFV